RGRAPEVARGGDGGPGSRRPARHVPEVAQLAAGRAGPGRNRESGPGRIPLPLGFRAAAASLPGSALHHCGGSYGQPAPDTIALTGSTPGPVRRPQSARVTTPPLTPKPTDDPSWAASTKTPKPSP